jgi:aminoglycoside phosphotransferase (APT) family kinase protein
VEPDRDLESALTSVLRTVLSDATVAIRDLRQLTGGASRQIWACDAIGTDGHVLPLILRRDPPSLVRPEGMALEAAAIKGAARQGVPVPDIIATGNGDDGIGSPYILMKRIEGETLPRRILREPTLAGARSRLASHCGEILARIHQIPTQVLWTEPVSDPLLIVREELDQYLEVGIGTPALELGMRWLDEHRISNGRLCIVHGDFRNGNLIVGPEGIRAVLDWERVHIGDPMRDLGWLCVRAWRFGNAKPVGGFGEYDELFSGYERVSGASIDRELVRWWEVFGTLWWGVGCVRMAQRHREGRVRSVELAAIGRRLCENEYDLLRLIDGRR